MVSGPLVAHYLKDLAAFLKGVYGGPYGLPFVFICGDSSVMLYWGARCT